MHPLRAVPQGGCALRCQASDLPQMLSDGSTLYVPSVGQWSSAAGWAYALADASGTIVQTYTYAPFGELLAAQGTRSSALQYAGEQKDIDTGLVYLRARWYDSATGRFTTRDPFQGFAVLPQTQHPYVYVGNNPVNLTDPSGKFAFLPLLVVAVVGGIIGGVSYYTLQAVLNADPCLGVQWHWQEALFWGGAGGVIGGLIGAGAYGGWQLGAKAIAWLRAISLGGGDAAGATIVRTLQSADLSAIKQFIQDAIRINGGRWGFTYGEKWQEMFDNLARLRDQLEVFAVRTGDRITGLMQVARQPIVHNGENALLVRYMEGLGGGAGTALLQKAYQFSLESGFGGRILLYATDQSRAWYMTHFPGFTYDAAQDIFYWSAAAAKAAFGQ